MKTINFNNHKFQISKEGILFWIDKQIAIISDLHLEKGSSFGSYRQFLPPYDSEETLKKIFKATKNHEIKKIILLGDTFHDKNAFDRMSEKVFILFKSLIEKYEVIFILGNHESKFEIGGINFLNEYVIDDIHFIHQALPTSIFQISGHFHPVASVKSSIKKITAKCLLHTNNHIIMPSFGQYTGGLNINNPVFKPFVNNESNIYMLTKKSIYKFTSKEVEI